MFYVVKTICLHISIHFPIFGTRSASACPQCCVQYLHRTHSAPLNFTLKISIRRHFNQPAYENSIKSLIGPIPADSKMPQTVTVHVVCIATQLTTVSNGLLNTQQLVTEWWPITLSQYFGMCFCARGIRFDGNRNVHMYGIRASHHWLVDSFQTKPEQECSGGVLSHEWASLIVLGCALVGPYFTSSRLNRFPWNSIDCIQGLSIGRMRNTPTFPPWQRSQIHQNTFCIENIQMDLHDVCVVGVKDRWGCIGMKLQWT